MIQPEIHNKKCPVCEQEFQTYIKIQKYCTKKCQDAYFNKKRQDKIEANRKPVIKKCLNCKKEFKADVRAPFTRYCSRECQVKDFKERNRDRINENKREWYSKNKDKVYLMNQKAKDKARFGGNRRKAMSRDKFQCTQCDKQYPYFRLAVHHIDEDKQNNTLDNLITLCCSCHAKVHSKVNKDIK